MITMALYKLGFLVMVINFDTLIDTWQGFGLVQFLIPAPPPFFITGDISPKSEINFFFFKSKKK
jgi:hypothetical protein